MPNAAGFSEACYEKGKQVAAAANLDYIIKDMPRGIYIVADGIGHGKGSESDRPGVVSFVEEFHRGLIASYRQIKRSPEKELLAFFRQVNQKLSMSYAPCQVDVAYVPIRGHKYWLFRAGDTISGRMRKGQKKVDWFEKDTPLLGIMKAEGVKVWEFPIEEGDLLVMATDGALHYKEYTERIDKILSNGQSVDGKADALKAFFREDKPWDDHSVLVYEH